jgi:hypothetical protein
LGKFPFQTLFAALLLLALAFSVHDRSAAQAQNEAQSGLELSCESNSNQQLDTLRPAASRSLNCPIKVAKK